jgi:hypothetical protein
MANDPIHPVQPKVEELEVGPEATLEQVSDELPVSEAATSELIRIEEALAYAREVAKQAHALRSRVDADASPPVS